MQSLDSVTLLARGMFTRKGKMWEVECGKRKNARDVVCKQNKGTLNHPLTGTLPLSLHYIYLLTPQYIIPYNVILLLLQYFSKVQALIHNAHQCCASTFKYSGWSSSHASPTALVKVGPWTKACKHNSVMWSELKCTFFLINHYVIVAILLHRYTTNIGEYRHIVQANLLPPLRLHYNMGTQVVK